MSGPGMDNLGQVFTNARDKITEIEPDLKKALEKATEAKQIMESAMFSGNPERIRPLLQLTSHFEANVRNQLTQLYALYAAIEAVKRGQSL